jgi:hypothetical protein
VPVPLRGMARPAPEINRLPAVVPVPCGAKLMFKVTLCPPSRVRGNADPFVENPTPVVWSAEKVVFNERAFVSTTGTVDTVPIAT